MTLSFTASGHATLIGSLPCRNHQEALDLILQHTPHIPLWPQLPHNPQEGMLNQFTAGFPGFVENEATFFDTTKPGFDEEQLAFFEEYLRINEDPSLLDGSVFQMDRIRAEGIYLLLERLAHHDAALAVKGQVTGPFTLLTGLKDASRQDAYYDPELREIGVKGIAMRAAWQTRFLGQAGLPVLVFIDEPALAGLGSSAYISVSLDELRQELTEVIDAIHQEKGLAGIHVCANTDWDFLLSLPLDIVSFDAFGYFDRLVGCRDAVTGFLNRGGVIAWGIVPTSEAEKIDKATAADLVALWESQAEGFQPDGYDKATLLRQTLVTPSCGTGSLDLARAVKVLELTRTVSATLREKYLG